MNFNDMDLTLSFKPLSSEPQLVFIPVDEERGIVAVVKPFGNGQASCIAFAPATSKHMPFSNFKPSFLRKVVTTDFALRQGNWKPLQLDAPSSTTLKNAVTVLMGELERTAPENVIEIDTTRPANTSSAPDVAFASYKVGEHTPFEQGLRHLMGVQELSKQNVSADGAVQEQPKLDDNGTAAA